MHSYTLQCSRAEWTRSGDSQSWETEGFLSSERKTTQKPAVKGLSISRRLAKQAVQDLGEHGKCQGEEEAACEIHEQKTACWKTCFTKAPPQSTSSSFPIDSGGQFLLGSAFSYKDSWRHRHHLQVSKTTAPRGPLWALQPNRVQRGAGFAMAFQFLTFPGGWLGWNPFFRNYLFILFQTVMLLSLLVYICGSKYLYFCINISCSDTYSCLHSHFC